MNALAQRVLKKTLGCISCKMHVFHPSQKIGGMELTVEKRCAILSRQDQAFEEAGEGPLFTVNWLTFSCGLWFRCRAEHHRTWAFLQLKIVHLLQGTRDPPLNV